MRILIAEDEELMADAIATGLRRAGHAVDVALDGARALEALFITDYDVMVLDRDLPQVHGDQVCREATARGRPTRILMVTAASDVDDRVDGLRLGADDYLGKPFAFRELIARVEALGRRAAPVRQQSIVIGDLLVDLTARRAELGGREIELTRKEFGVLAELAAANGAWVSAERLLERVWDENADPFTHVVRMTMARLRRKLGDVPIETKRGVGYRIAR